MSTTHCTSLPEKRLAACSQIHLAPSARTLRFWSLGKPSTLHSLSQLAPMMPQEAMAQTAILAVGGSSTPSFHSLGAAGATGSRLLRTLRRISRQPSTVLIFKPSVENSTTPVAAAKDRNS